MAESLGKAILELDADASPLEAALSVAQSDSLAKVQEMGAAIKKVFGGNLKAGLAVAGAAGVVAIGALGVAVYKLGETFDEALDIIATKTGATGPKLDALKGTFKEVFASVPTDANSAATAVGELNQRLGLTGAPLADLSKKVLELSRMTGTDLSTNIETVSKAFVDWEVPTNKMGETLDGFFALSQKSGISVNDLASSVQRFGSPLRQLGFSLEESAAMFATFERAGVNTGTAMAGVKMAVANLNQPTDKLSAQMKQLGIDAKTPEDRLRQVFSVLTDEGIPAADRTGLAMQVFGKRAGADIAEAVKQGRFQVDEMVKTFRSGRGSIEKTSDETKDLAENWQVFKNKLAVKLQPISAKVFDGVNTAITFLLDHAGLIQPIIVGLIAIIAALAVAATAAGIAMAAAWIAGLSPFILIAAAVAAVVVVVIAYWDQLKGYLSAYWPIIVGILTGGIGLIVALVIKNFGAIKDFVIGVWNAIADTTSSVWGAITGALSSVWNTIKGIVSSTWNAIKSIITSAWNAIKSATTSVWNSIVSFIGGIPGKIKAALSSLASIVASIARSAWDAFKEATINRIEAVVGVARDIGSKIKNAVGSLGHLLYDEGRAIVQGLLDGIKSLLSSVYGTVSKVGSKIKSLKGPLPKDRVLLIDEGRAIIGGLRSGMNRELAALYREVQGYAPNIQGSITAETPSVSASPSLQRLTAALESLAASGTPGVIDALVGVVNERIGYGALGARRATAGDGSVTL